MSKETNVFNWNPVFRFVMEVKHRYEKQFSALSDTDYDFCHNSKGEQITCFEYWIERLNNQDYIDRIRFLELNQNKELLLLRYARYSNIFDSEEEATLEEIWEMYDGFYMECRSIVIDLKNEEIALCPFKKFRNLNECAENMLDVVKEEINNAFSVEISNKLDGSMQSARFYNGKLLMSGSQAINPENSWRLQDGYRMMNENPNYIEMLQDCPDFTFIFEYISLSDSHIVKYKKEQEGLYLVGVRDVTTGTQRSYRLITALADTYGVKRTDVFDKTLDDVLEDVKTIKSSEQEGFVMNIDGRLIKIKGDDYVQIHRILSKLSSINLIIRAIADDTIDDLKAKIPTAYHSRVEVIGKIMKQYARKQNEIVQNYYRKAPKDNKKDFMIWVSDNVPKKYQSYVRNCYLNIKNNFFKKHTSSDCPKYIKLIDMGISREDYKNIFVE